MMIIAREKVGKIKDRPTDPNFEGTLTPHVFDDHLTEGIKMSIVFCFPSES